MAITAVGTSKFISLPLIAHHSSFPNTSPIIEPSPLFSPSHSIPVFSRPLISISASFQFFNSFRLHARNLNHLPRPLSPRQAAVADGCSYCSVALDAEGVDDLVGQRAALCSGRLAWLSLWRSKTTEVVIIELLWSKNSRKYPITSESLALREKQDEPAEQKKQAWRQWYHSFNRISPLLQSSPSTNEFRQLWWGYHKINVFILSVYQCFRSVLLSVSKFWEQP